MLNQIISSWLKTHALKCIVGTEILWTIIVVLAFGHLILRKFGLVRDITGL